MNITPLYLAQQCAQLYTSADGWAHYWQTDDVVLAHAALDDGTDLIVLRGSMTTEDWIRDATAVPVWHSGLGFCHGGFLAGMDDVFSEVRYVVDKKVIITGHSLGGARARILAGMFAYNALPVDTLCVFGSPKPAFVNLARIIQKSGMTHISHRNRNDIVPTVPLDIPPFFDFVHTEDWITLNAEPAETDMEPLRDHHIALYVQGLEKHDLPAVT